VQLADVNVLVAAHRPDAPDHAGALPWLQSVLEAVEPFGVVEQVLASFVRVVTNRRIFTTPTTPAEALAFCGQVRDAPSALIITSGPRHWEVFAGLCREGNLKANAVPDAYLAAFAIEQGATLVTYDRGFARFPGLRWALPTA
jgi:toxin-antitoxin system PIN domain toxin